MVTAADEEDGLTSRTLNSGRSPPRVHFGQSDKSL